MKVPKKMKSDALRIQASFRDPEGFLFIREGNLYRQINLSGKTNYDLLMFSGLYEKLAKAGRLIRHEEIDLNPAEPSLAYKIVQPVKIPFITYPYEWCFSQLKDAALLTLAIQDKALAAGMSLKDASAYNIQFLHGKPLLIDTLSFEQYCEGQPWTAYRQFCQHFLAPLALMASRDIRLGQLLRIYIDGVPLDLASHLLPMRTRFNPGLATHIHIHAVAQQRFADVSPESAKIKGSMSKLALSGLIGSLRKTVLGLRWRPKGSEWGDYYDSTNYTRTAFDAKGQIVQQWLQSIQPKMVWDLGANSGTFSRVAVDLGASVISADLDPAAVENNYLEAKKNKEKNILPVMLDLTNPSPGIGWANQERSSFLERGPADAVLALALIHHLAISNNVPLPILAELFSRMGEWLIVEFIPKTDSQVQRLLSTRKDIFPDYYENGFEKAFSQYFKIIERQPIPDSQRVLYRMQLPHFA